MCGRGGSTGVRVVCSRSWILAFQIDDEAEVGLFLATSAVTSPPNPERCSSTALTIATSSSTGACMAFDCEGTKMISSSSEDEDIELRD